MKKIRLIAVLSIVLLSILITNVYGETSSTVNFSSNVQNIKAGDTVDVFLNISNSNKINGFTSSINYEESVFENCTITEMDQENYSMISKTKDSIIAIASNSDGSENLTIKITLKVKEDATAGTTKLSTSKLIVDLLETDQTEEINGQEVTFNILSENPNITPSNPENGEDQGEIEGIKKENQNSGNGQAKDESIAKGKIPQTGNKIYFTIASVFSVVLAVICYIKYNKYKKI